MEFGSVNMVVQVGNLDELVNQFAERGQLGVDSIPITEAIDLIRDFEFEYLAKVEPNDG